MGQRVVGSEVYVGMGPRVQGQGSAFEVGGKFPIL